MFRTFFRPTEYLQEFIESEHFAEFEIPPTAKRVVTFLRSPAEQSMLLPISRDDSSILEVIDSEVVCAYIPCPKDPTFMNLLERTLGVDITTRTLDTVRKCSLA